LVENDKRPNSYEPAARAALGATSALIVDPYSAVAPVAICGYMCAMASTGIRELKDNLSRYIRRIEAGERIAITAHGRVVAELVPPGSSRQGRRASRFDELVADGVIRAPLEPGDPTRTGPRSGSRAAPRRS
jgi:prevent-host-death family protein